MSLATTTTTMAPTTLNLRERVVEMLRDVCGADTLITDDNLPPGEQLNASQIQVLVDGRTVKVDWEKMVQNWGLCAGICFNKIFKNIP
jgi:hypothetical protein